ncbi:MAG: hypothetical protein NC231_05365 [Bacillus sp. (in: Bacteria)]|nr:hypothetical protein [Bacillus sp. (in: firmicutes)]MCM1425962.1 hypothetical protein [Eubacterium sp.]
MELKYYLRGLGLGIIVTAIIMAVVTPRSRTMTDAEVIRRAKQLGMIEDTVLSENAAKKEDADAEDATGENAAQDGDTAADEDTKQQTSAAVSDGDSRQPQADANTAVNRQEQPQADVGAGDGQQTQAVSNTASEQRTQAASNTESDRQAQTESDEGQDAAAAVTDNTNRTQTDADMVVTIGSGDGSYAASRKLADIGAISSPENFDTFLCENGYDKKIRPGTYTIPADASDEQMARIITGAE